MARRKFPSLLATARPSLRRWQPWPEVILSSREALDKVLRTACALDEWLPPSACHALLDTLALPRKSLFAHDVPPWLVLIRAVVMREFSRRPAPAEF
jgi:hypothetical protein